MRLKPDKAAEAGQQGRLSAPQLLFVCVKNRTVFVQPCVCLDLMCIYYFGIIVEELLRMYRNLFVCVKNRTVFVQRACALI